MKVLYLLPLAVALAGCQTLQDASNVLGVVTGSSVTAQQVDVAASSFDALEGTAAQYLRLPLCPGATLCRTQAVSQTIYTKLKAGRSARIALEGQVQNGGNGSVSNYNVLVTAISTIQALIPAGAAK